MVLSESKKDKPQTLAQACKSLLRVNHGELLTPCSIGVLAFTHRALLVLPSMWKHPCRQPRRLH